MPSFPLSKVRILFCEKGHSCDIQYIHIHRTYSIIVYNTHILLTVTIEIVLLLQLKSCYCYTWNRVTVCSYYRKLFLFSWMSIMLLYNGAFVLWTAWSHSYSKCPDYGVLVMQFGLYPKEPFGAIATKCMDYAGDLTIKRPD